MAATALACALAVSAYFGLPPRVLPAIQGVERGWPGAAIVNRNGSEDLGVMQVNTRWIPALAAYTGQPGPVVRRRLQDDTCFNIAAAGAILHTYRAEAQGNLMRAIGYYHSHTPPLHAAYRLRVVASAQALFGGTAQTAGGAGRCSVTRC